MGLRRAGSGGGVDRFDELSRHARSSAPGGIVYFLYKPSGQVGREVERMRSAATLR
jgi:hypothetical protein